MASDMSHDQEIKSEKHQECPNSRTYDGNVEGGKSFDSKSLPSVEDGADFSMDEAKFIDDIARSPRKTSYQRKEFKGNGAIKGNGKNAKEKPSARGENQANKRVTGMGGVLLDTIPPPTTALITGSMSGKRKADNASSSASRSPTAVGHFRM